MSIEQINDVREVRVVLGQQLLSLINAGAHEHYGASLDKLVADDDPTAYAIVLHIAKRRGFDPASVQPGETFRISVLEQLDCERAPQPRRTAATNYLFTLFLTAGPDGRITEAPDEVLDRLAGELLAPAPERPEPNITEQDSNSTNFINS